MGNKKEKFEYEAVVILKPDLKETELNHINNNIKEKINNIGNVIEEDNIGIKRLAYEFKKYKEGYYKIYSFETEENYKNNFNELEHFFRSNEDILKFIIVKRG